MSAPAGHTAQSDPGSELTPVELRTLRRLAGSPLRVDMWVTSTVRVLTQLQKCHRYGSGVAAASPPPCRSGVTNARNGP